MIVVSLFVFCFIKGNKYRDFLFCVMGCSLMIEIWVWGWVRGKFIIMLLGPHPVTLSCSNQICKEIYDCYANRFLTVVLIFKQNSTENDFILSTWERSNIDNEKKLKKGCVHGRYRGIVNYNNDITSIC